MRPRRLFASLAVASLLAGCIGAHSFKEADALIARFRALAAAGDYARIYALGGDDFKAQTSLADITARVGGVQRSAGACGAPARTGESFLSTPEGAFVTERFARTCAGGVIVETFVIQMQHGGAVLQSYRAESSAPEAAPPAGGGADDGSI